MRKPNFNKLSDEILAGYKNEIELILKDRKQVNDKKNKLLKKMKSMAESEGISLDTLLADAPRKAKKVAAKKTGRKVKPKYINPKDVSQTWTGRGRKPLWVAAHLKKSGKITDLEI